MTIMIYGKKKKKIEKIELKLIEVIIKTDLVRWHICTNGVIGKA